MRPTRCILALLLVTVACQSTEPTSALPSGAVPMAAPAGYGGWWQATEACAGLTGSYSTVEWFVVPDADTFDPGNGSRVVGEWSRVGGATRIILAGRYAAHEMAVRHEMLHALLGKAGHPAEFFGTKCGLTWNSWEG